MKWMTRYFILPILLNLSLTSVSIAVLYVLYKKERDIKSGKSHVKTSKTYMRECKVPKQFVPLIIGKGGSVIKDIQNKTGTQLHFKEDIEFPDHTCIIKGNYEAIFLAEQMIKCIIKNQPIIEVSPLGVRRKIIKDASKFNNIQEMEDLSGPTITIVHPYNLYYPDSDKKVFIKGTTQEIATIITQIKNNSRAGIEACAKDRYVEKFCSTVFNARGQSYYAGFLPLYYEDLIQVYVTAKKNPHQFWVQVVDPDIKIFDKLMSEMTTYYNNKVNYEMHKLIDIAVDRLVAVKSDTRGKWCRGKIVSKVAKNVCKVRLMDYGDSEVATLNDVLEIRDNFLVLRFQAIECSLDNIKPPQGSKWTYDQSAFFEDLIWSEEPRIFYAWVGGINEEKISTQRDNNMVPRIDLYYEKDNEWLNVAEDMLNEGYGVLEKGILTFVDGFSSVSSSLSYSLDSEYDDEIDSPSSVCTSPKPTLSSEMLAKTSDKSDSPDASVMNLKMKSFISCQTSSPSVEKIVNDLITPQKPVKSIEEINLVTPVKDEAHRFIKNDRDDCCQNEAGNQSGKPRIRMPIDKFAQIAPAGYESDLSDASDASDNLTLG